MATTHILPREAEAFESTDADVCFQITDFFVPEADKSKRELYKEQQGRGEYKPAEDFSVILYGCTEQGHSVCVQVTDYQPYFYLRISNGLLSRMGPSVIQEELQMFLEYESYMDKRFHKERKIITKHYEGHLVGIELVNKREFMGFTNNALFPFLKVTVRSLGLFNSLKYFFMTPPDEFNRKFGKDAFRLYESNIDPMLRFIHDRNILPCGWVKLPADCYTIHEKGIEFARTNYCVQIHYEDIMPLNKNNTAPLLIASFDIECTSSHGDFPVAIKDYLKLGKDLVALARYAKYSRAELGVWLARAYYEDVIVNSSVKIHRLYAKRISKNIDEKKIDELFVLLQSVKTDCGEDSDDEEEEVTKPASTVAAQEFRVCQLLNTFLPPLQGDAIIQIGTTVHRYGSDEIIYKSMVSLKSCDPIEGVDLKCCKTEGELLYAWRNVIQNIDPDILLGYNIFGFDMPYVWERAKELGLQDFGIGLGRQTERRCTMLTQNLSSAALGDNVLKYFDMDGVVLVDMYKVMQRSPLDSYKLDFVAHLFLGDNKNDIKPHEIFEKFKGSSADRKEIAEYCIQDCALVNRLFHKLKVLENNNAMGNVCLVPLSYLFMRGQGVKIFSLVAQFCKDKNYAIPVLRGFHEKSLDEEVDGYEGAIVLNPKEGMYLEDAITVLDYSSLYPSSMIERNLSHDCYVNDPKYDNLPGVDYCTVSYDLYEGVGDKKVKVGEKHCKFVQLPEGEKGLIPQILMKLLKQRKNTRKKIEYETLVCVDGRSFAGIVREKEDKYLVTDVEKNETSVVPKNVVVERKETYNAFEKLVFDALQVAYKVTANSLYGQIGSRVSPIYLKDIAACTTATGRERIMMAKKFVEEQYGAEVIYGDSVTGYTPVTLRVKGEVVVDKIEDLAKKYGGDKWMACVEAGRQEKEACELPDWIEVLSDKGWTRIHRVIRHGLAEHKRIVRVLTHTAVVDVTDDHSLLLKNGEEISPKSVVIGTELLHADIPVNDINIDMSSLTIDEARIMGFFMGDGSCGTYNCPSGIKSSWALNNATISRLEYYKSICEKVYPDYIWKILDTLDSSGVYKLVPYSKGIRTIKEFTDYYRSLMYANKEKVIPSSIMRGSTDIRLSFWEGLYDADGDKDKHGYIRIDQKNMLSAQMIYLLAISLGYKASINTRLDKHNIFRVTMTKGSQRLNPHAVKKIYEIPYEGFVYDLTTDNHHFQAGIGQMIVHNTDSIFIKFPFYDPEGNRIRGRDTLALGIAAGQKASQEIKSILPPPQSLEYEKTFFPFIIFSKKRYVGLLYEDDANKKPKQKSMGIVLKRRDNAPLVKKIYGGIIDILLTKYDLGMSVEFLRNELQKLVSSQYPLEDLIITKTLKGSYKDRTKIAHCVLADRMGERDPGNKPQINDRIPYVYIQTGGNVKLQGDKIEHPDYVREKQLLPDYQFYITNQLMKPICQLYALCVEKLPDYVYPPSYWAQWDEELKGKPMYEDDTKRKNRVDALREQEVENLLFSAFLDVKRKVRVLGGSKVGEEGNVSKKKKIVVESDVGENAPKLCYRVSENKEAKVYKWECDFCLNGMEVWRKSGEIVKKQLTKTAVSNKVMYEVFKEIFKEHTGVIQEQGIILEFDKYYARMLRTAITKQDDIQKDMVAATASTDIEAFQACAEVFSTMKIAMHLLQFKHKFL